MSENTPIIIIVDDQKAYADRVAVRLKWRGIPEKNIKHFENAEQAKSFIENADARLISAVVSDYHNGKKSNITGVEILDTAEKKDANIIRLLISSEDRSKQPDIADDNGGTMHPFLTKHQHKRIGLVLNEIKKKFPQDQLIENEPIALFREEYAIYQTLIEDFHIITNQVFGNPPFANLANNSIEKQHILAFNEDAKTRQNLNSSGDSGLTKTEIKNVEYPPQIVDIQKALLTMFSIIKDVEYSMSDIAKYPQEIVSQYHKNKSVCVGDLGRLSNMCADMTAPLGYSTLLQLQDFITKFHKGTTPQDADSLRHDVNHLVAAISESVQGFPDCLDKLKTHFDSKASEVTVAANKRSKGLSEFVNTLLKALGTPHT